MGVTDFPTEGPPMADERDVHDEDTTAEQTWDDESPSAASDEPAGSHVVTKDEVAADEPIGTPVSATGSSRIDDDGTLFRKEAAQPAVGFTNQSVRAEHERLQAERAARRQARLDALNPAPVAPVVPANRPAAVAAADAERRAAAPAVREVVTEKIVTTRNTDKFLPSLGLFLLRLVTAAIFGIHGVNKLLNIPATTDMIGRTLLPYPSILAVVVGAAEVAIAIALVFGLLTRVAGLGVVLITVGALVFVLWGQSWSPFAAGEAGFIGELELLLAAVGVLFMSVGAGGWAVDRGFRARRSADRAAREA